MRNDIADYVGPLHRASRMATTRPMDRQDRQVGLLLRVDYLLPPSLLPLGVCYRELDFFGKPLPHAWDSSIGDRIPGVWPRPLLGVISYSRMSLL